MEQTHFQYFVEELNKTMLLKYKTIENLYESQYGYPELDPVRGEICRCLVCGLNQAAITLTNHLLEKSLKHFLIIKYSKEHKTENTKIENAFNKKGIDFYNQKKCDLEFSINQACSQGLITKEHKKLLIKFKNRFRNPYSHANTNDIFKEIPVKGKGISLIEGETDEDLLKRIFDDNTEYLMPAKYMLPAQGLLQAMIAERDSIPYFVEVDKIIRSMMSNIKGK
jgi:hypothetical protein